MSACGIPGAAAAALINVCAIAAPHSFLEPVAPGVHAALPERPLFERRAGAQLDRSTQTSPALEPAPARTAPLPAVAWTGLVMIGGMIVAAAAKRRKQ